MQWSHSYARSDLCAGLSSHAYLIGLSIKSLMEPEPCLESHSQSIKRLGYYAGPIDAIGPHLRPLSFYEPP